jgi:predicted RNase H-like nuclease (RuvC/YqgF family)
VTSARASASRSAATSRLRRASEVVLVAGTVIAVAAAFGPHWATRVGVAVAVAAAVVGSVCAWRELFHVERRHAHTLLQTTQRHGDQLREERRHNAEVVDTLTERVLETVAVVDGQRVTIAGLRHEVFSLEGDRTSLRTAVADRDRTITSLRTTVQKQEVQIEGLETRVAELEQELDEDGAQVHRLPALPQDELDALTEREDSLVLDLRTLETIRGVLPNYEADRRFA